MCKYLVVMGVAGCGKSSVAAALSMALGLPLIEGDEHHSSANRTKMNLGVALDDADRADWLATLAAQLQAQPQGAVLTCSALKRKYRDSLRVAVPGLRFVFLEIDRATAQARVAGRGAAHFFSSDLVASQFDALENPSGEPRVLRLDATSSISNLSQAVSGWLHNPETT